jgi:CDP-paratose 2-epimerase
MSVAVITGAAGLIGGESVRFFADKGFDIAGIDNDMRRMFFGPDASTIWHRQEHERRIKGYRHFDGDVRDRDAMAKIFSRYDRELPS